MKVIEGIILDYSAFTIRRAMDCSNMHECIELSIDGEGSEEKE